MQHGTLAVPVFYEVFLKKKIIVLTFTSLIKERSMKNLSKLLIIMLSYKTNLYKNC